MFGGDAEALAARKPKLVFSAPQRLLGLNVTHPLVEEYLASFSSVEAATNARGGVDYVVPPEAAVPGDDGKAVEGPTRFSAEELTAMLLGYARDFTAIAAEAPSGGAKPVIKEVVLTVPTYATQNERLALLDAAELAGLKVLALVDENTAAAVHYGIDRVFENTTHHLLLYNLGHEAAQVTLFAFDSYQWAERGSSKPKAVGQARVLAKAWDTSVGGRFFEKALVDYAASKFNEDKAKAKALPASAKGDVRNVPAAMAKLRKNVARAKEILSANEEYLLTVEGILPDVDFRTPFSRTILDKAATAAGLWPRLTAPIDSVLKQANVTLGSIHAVEIIGGGVRMPKVQALLREYMTAGAKAAGVPPAQLELGVHLNGDEAPALGAVFVAANRSASFRVRKVGMIDGYPWPVGVRVTHLHPLPVSTSAAASATAGAPGDESTHVASEDGGVEEGSSSSVVATAASSPGKAWSKRSALFRGYNALGSLKRITFTADADLRATLFYEAPAGAGVHAATLPPGTARTIGVYNITGIADLATDSRYGKLGTPKVTITFELDANGIVSVLRAEAALEEEYIPTPAPTPMKKAKAAASASPSATSSAESEDGSTSSTAEGTQESADTSAAPTAAAEAPSDSDTDYAAAASSDDDAAAATATATPTPAPQKRTLRIALAVVLDTEASLPVRPMSAGDKAAALATLRRLAKVDEEKRAREGAKNALEAYIYATRERLENGGDELEIVSTEEQRSEIRESLTSAGMSDHMVMRACCSRLAQSVSLVAQT